MRGVDCFPRHTPSGTALLKAILKGSLGTQSLDVVPPNLGGDGGIILTIPGGGTYCALFGGVAGGTEVKDDAALEGDERDRAGMPGAVARTRRRRSRFRLKPEPFRVRRALPGRFGSFRVPPASLISSDESRNHRHLE